MKKKENSNVMMIPSWHIKLESDLQKFQLDIPWQYVLVLIFAIISWFIVKILFSNYENIDLLSSSLFLAIFAIGGLLVWYYRNIFKKITPSIWEYFAKYCGDVGIILKKISLYSELYIIHANTVLSLENYSLKISKNYKNLSETKLVDVMNKFYINLDKLRTLFENPHECKIDLDDLSNHFFILGEHAIKNDEINSSEVEKIIQLLSDISKQNKIERTIKSLYSYFNLFKKSIKIKTSFYIVFFTFSGIITYFIATYMDIDFSPAVALSLLVFFGMPTLIVSLKKLI